MFTSIIIIAALFAWWVCGVINIVIMYQLNQDQMESFYHGKSNRLFCLGFGPLLTLGVVLWLFVRLPIKYGCSWGMTFARKLDKFRNS